MCFVVHLCIWCFMCVELHAVTGFKSSRDSNTLSRFSFHLRINNVEKETVDISPNNCF